MEPIAVYVHVPFCPHKCGYCDFNSYAMDGPIVRRTVEAIRAEIGRSPWKEIPAKTIFFGGGTPTHIPADDLCGLLEEVTKVHPPIEGCEITSEANPGTVDAAKFGAMKKAGFNRVSLGAQSFRPDELRVLERIHSPGDVERAVEAARTAGFQNINLDLMFALPKQSADRWQSNLGRAIDLAPEHLSLYCLTIEPNTSFYKKFNAGLLNLPSEDAQVEMYDMTIKRMRAAGYEQYEISNFAKPGFECRHNMEYWLGRAYAGYGPGAVGVMDGANVGAVDGLPVRYTNLKHPARYCEAVEGSGPVAFEHEVLTSEIRSAELIMLGLRLNSGIDRKLVAGRNHEVDELSRLGWIDSTGPQIRLTDTGRHFCSEVAMRLM